MRKWLIYLIVIVIFSSYTYASVLELGETWAGGGSIDDWYGVKCVALKNITIINATLAPSSEVPYCTIFNTSNNAQLVNATVTGLLCDINHNLTANQGFRLTEDPRGTNYQGGHVDLDEPLPISNDLINCTHGTYEVAPMNNDWTDHATFVWAIASIGAEEITQGGGPPPSPTLTINHNMVNTTNYNDDFINITFNGTLANHNTDMFNCTVIETNTNYSKYDVNLSNLQSFKYNLSGVETTLNFSIDCVNYENTDKTSVYTYKVDVVLPQITTDIVNNSNQLKDNTLTVTTTISDTNLFAYNITWFDTDDTVIENIFAENLTVTSAQNISSYVMATAGNNYSYRVEVWDSHTAQFIEDYKIDYLKDGIEFEDKVKIEAVTTSFETTKHFDRYTFDMEFKETEKLNISVYLPLFKVVSNSRYTCHLISLESMKWIDFESEDVKNCEIVKEDSNNAIVMLEFNKPITKTSFNSIGDLNYASEKYFFNVISQDTLYLSQINDNVKDIEEAINMIWIVVLWLITTVGGVLLIQNSYNIAGYLTYFFSFMFDLLISADIVTNYVDLQSTSTYAGFMYTFAVYFAVLWLFLKAVIGITINWRQKARR